jgi:hypothetical protein
MPAKKAGAEANFRAGRLRAWEGGGTGALTTTLKAQDLVAVFDLDQGCRIFVAVCTITDRLSAQPGDGGRSRPVVIRTVLPSGP